MPLPLSPDLPLLGGSPIGRPEAATLLRWYDRHRRRLPWRAEPGETPDPYGVWLSEIMLQQTTVAAVIPYYERFLRRFPTVRSLAEAELDAVLPVWAGLGYYARARNLHACAREVVALGGFPRDAASLARLPGIGAYTSVAIAAIAFGRPGVPVDGNVTRVMARVGRIGVAPPALAAAVRAEAARLAEDPGARARPADLAQALFDLGATVCAPARPACTLCPWRDGCGAFASGEERGLPRKAAKAARPVRHGVHFWLTDESGRVALRRRPESGLLGGMEELPGTPWRPEAWTLAEAEDHAPAPARWRRLGEVRHVFTHFELRLDVYAGIVQAVPGSVPARARDALAGAALPSVMRKCVRLAMSEPAAPAAMEPIGMAA